MMEGGVAGIVFAQQVFRRSDFGGNIVQPTVTGCGVEERIPGGVGLHELRSVKGL